MLPPLLPILPPHCEPTNAFLVSISSYFHQCFPTPLADISCHGNLQYFPEELSPTRYQRIEHLLPRSVVCGRLDEPNQRDVGKVDIEVGSAPLENQQKYASILDNTVVGGLGTG